MPAETKPVSGALSIDSWRSGDLKKAPASEESGKGLQETPLVKCRILIVDADAEGRHRIGSTLEDLNHQLIEVSSTSDALVAVAKQTIDMVMVDARVPEIGGVALCQILRKMPATQIVPIFILGTVEDRDLEVQAFSAGADEFFIAPIKPTALRARVHATLRLKSMMASLDNSEAVLFSLAKSVEDRDPDLGQHCQRLALMASAMGLALGLPPADIRSLQHGGYLHDIGKIGIPDRILFKAGPLTPDEWEIMRSHSVRGERICACMKSLAPVLPIIRHHHEKYDGTGYPDGLKGHEIPLLARILQVVDIYDALTTERPYKRAYTPEEAMVIMREETKKGWRDPQLVDVFADLLPLFRHPSMSEASSLSLQALAESLEHYRKTSLRQPISA